MNTEIERLINMKLSESLSEETVSSFKYLGLEFSPYSKLPKGRGVQQKFSTQSGIKEVQPTGYNVVSFYKAATTSGAEEIDIFTCTLDGVEHLVMPCGQTLLGIDIKKDRVAK